MANKKEPLPDAVREFFSKAGKKGGLGRWKRNQTPEERSKSSRDAAMKRWHPEQTKDKQREEDFAETAA